MKKIAIVILFAHLAAVAGKEEREYMKTEVTPAVNTSIATLKKSCGCDVKMSVDEKTVTTSDDMYQVKHMAESITEGAPKHCTDAESKKAICKMKTLKMTKAKESTFTFAGTTGTMSTDGQSSTTFEMISAELDK